MSNSKNELLEYAIYNGILEEGTKYLSPFAEKEVISREEGIKAIKKLKPETTIFHQPLYSTFDLIDSDEICYEIKYRDLNSDVYSDDMLSSNKYFTLKEISYNQKKKVKYVVVFKDKVARIYDIDAPVERRITTHRKYTVVDSQYIVENAFFFNKVNSIQIKYE